MAVTLRQTQPGVAEKFLADLRLAVEDVKSRPPSAEGMAPIYGMAATLPLRGVVGDVLREYGDLLYEV